MLRLNIVIICFVSSFLIINYIGNVGNDNDIALSQSEPEIKYDGHNKWRNYLTVVWNTRFLSNYSYILTRILKQIFDDVIAYF